MVYIDLTFLHKVSWIIILTPTFILPTVNRDLVKKDVIWIFMDVYPESWVVELQPLVCGVVPRRRPVTSRFAGEQFVNVSGYFTNW